MHFSHTQNVPNLTAAEASPQTPLNNLAKLPRPVAKFKEKAPRKEMREKKNIRNGKGKEEKRNGEELALKALGEIDTHAEVAYHSYTQ